MISKAALKNIRALKLKKYRSKERKFLVEGMKSVREALSSTLTVEMVVATRQVMGEFKSDSPLYEIDQQGMQAISSLSTNETCLAVVNMPTQQLFKPSETKPTVILDGIQDPGNLGTIIRTMDWFGFNQLICSEDTVDFYNPKSIAATMGSFTRIQPKYLSIEQLLDQYDYPVFGMEMNGISIAEIKFSSKSFIILGNESHGIREGLAAKVGQSVTIPGQGRAESLNVAMAAGMLLYRLAID